MSARARRQNAFIEARESKISGELVRISYLLATARSAGTLSVTNLLVKSTLRTVLLVKTEPRVKNNRTRPPDRVITAFNLQRESNYIACFRGKVARILLP